MSLSIGLAADPAPCFALRKAVFVEEQGFDPAGEFDALDKDAEHLLAEEAGVPVGTARLIAEGETGRIGRICVTRARRGTGLGAALVEAGVARLAERGFARIVLGAQVRAMGFYEKLGFTPCGAVYDDEGVPHREMERQLQSGRPGGQPPEA